MSAWDTRYGMRVDMLAAAAYILGPLSGEPTYPWSIVYVNLTASALLLLVLETHNDYVRFHGTHEPVLDGSKP